MRSDTRLLTKWNRVTDLCRLAYASKFVLNASAPLSVMLVGPPGDGKSTLLKRFVRLPGVCEVDNFTQTSLYPILEQAQMGVITTLVVSDFGTLVNKRASVVEPTMALLASATSDGVHFVTSGPHTKKHFGGTTLSVLTAITPDDFRRRRSALNANAFLTRFFLIDFTPSQAEQEAYLDLKYAGDDRLLKPVRHLDLRERKVEVAKRYTQQARTWWRQMMDSNPYAVAGMRTADAFVTLLKCAALLRGDKRVTVRDIKAVGRLQPIWEAAAFTEKDTVRVRKEVQPFQKATRGRKRK